MTPKPCGLISVIPPAFQAEWAARLPEFVKRFRPSAIVLEVPFQADLILAAKPLELAVLCRNEIELAKRAGADGVYLAGSPRDVAEARAVLGSAAIIGAECALSRHDAMEKAEAGADFVAFNAREEKDRLAALELAAWWDEVTLIPAALDLGAIPAHWTIGANASADFLIVEECRLAGESLTFATELGLQSAL